MSSDSETTTSSKLRQFGLYRTIDARTEEFLKLSRRRQIRQGCACAAVSTAITVTVVVSVLLVYEYGFHAEPGLGPRHRPHWLTMLNDTDAFDNIQKNSFNVNRNTIKLIPILLKAIKQNRYLEAVLDDYPSQTPANDKDTTDYPLERNIFTDARNWIRTPTSRLYAIEYKSTPLIINHLFKTRNRDDFARSAKIMNSQRVKSYIDRMINDRVGYTPSDSQMAYDINIIPTIPPKRIALPYTRSKEQQDRVKQSSTKQSKEIKKLNCKCNNVGDILRKLLNTIQQLLPENEMCSNGNFLCGGSKLTTTTQKNTVRKSQLAKIVSRPGTEYKNIIKGDMAMNFRKLPKPSFEPKHKFLRKSNSLKNMISSMTSMQNKVPQNNISKKLLPKNKNILPSGNQNLDPGMVYISPGLTSDDTTTIRSYIEPTEEFDKEHTTTKPMMSSIKVNKDHRVKNHEQEVNESDLVDAYVSEAPTTISQPTTKPKQLQKLFNYGKDATRTRNQLDNLMQKIKTNKPSISKLHKYSQIEPHKSFPIKHQESSEWTPKLSKNKVRKIKDKRKKKMTNETEALDHFIYNATESFQPTEISSKNSSFIQVSSIDDVQTVENGFSEHQDYEHNFDENIYWSHEEDQKTRKNATIRQFQQKLDESNKNNLNYFDRSKILPAQSVQIPTKNHNVHTHVLPKLEEIFDTLTDFADARFNSTHGFYPGALAKNSAESLNPLKSMIPKSRPQFLEIRRKDVKQEGHDYDEDLNVNNYAYD